jgi:hypothetical protein
VRVEFRASSQWDGAPDSATVQQALEKAVFYFAEHGVTQRVMVYGVEDGALSSDPQLLAALPQPGELPPRPKPIDQLIVAARHRAQRVPRLSVPTLALPKSGVAGFGTCSSGR